MTLHWLSAEQMSTPPPFRIRCSQLGYYIRCRQRLAYDMMVHHHMIGKQPDGGSSVPADLSTCAHWHTQAALRCDFKTAANDLTYQGYDAPRATAAKYTPEQFTNGASMLGGDATTMQMMNQIAGDIIKHLPRTPHGWMAEAVIDTPYLSGHIDLLSADTRTIEDIKTTGLKPTLGRMKVTHFYQLIGYAIGVRAVTGELPREAHIVYAHNRGDWCFRSKPIVLAEHLATVDSVQRFCEYVADPDTMRQIVMTAVPAISDSECRADFCPYRGACGPVLIPDGVAIRDRPSDIPLSSARSIF